MPFGRLEVASEDDQLTGCAGSTLVPGKELSTPHRPPQAPFICMYPAKSDRMVIVIDDDIATFKALTRLGPQGGYTTKSFACCWDFAQWIKALDANAPEASLTMCLVIDAKALVSDVSWYVNEHIGLIPKICIGLPATTAPLSHLMNSFEGEFIRKPFTLAKIGSSIEAALGRHARLVEWTRQADLVLACLHGSRRASWRWPTWWGRGCPTWTLRRQWASRSKR